MGRGRIQNYYALCIRSLQLHLQVGDKNISHVHTVDDTSHIGGEQNVMRIGNHFTFFTF